MKQCPKCSRIYADDALNFCLDDGEWLVAPNVADEPLTAILSDEPSSKAQTAQHVTGIDPHQQPLALRRPTGFGRFALIGFIVLAFLSAVGMVVYKFAGFANSSKRLSFETARITRLTSSGKVGSATISPDGKYVAYSVSDESGQSSLWVRHIATSGNVQIVPGGGADANIGQTTFSPDGNYIYYTKIERNTPAALYSVPVLGGPSKKIADGVTRISFSPDGSRFTFERRYQSQGQDAVVVMNSDGSGEHVLAVRTHPEYYLPGPAWSPDGQTIACPMGGFDGGYYRSIAFIQVSDGSEKKLPFHRWNNLDRLVWLPDGSGIITTANDKPSDPYQIWFASFPSGEARTLTNDLSEYRNVSLTSDSTGVVAVVSETTANLWVAPITDLTHGQQLTASKHNGTRGVTWTPDGRIIYNSDDSGNDELWITTKDGQGKKRLTDDGNAKRYPCMTHDGQYIVFDSYRSGAIDLWRIDADGSNAKPLTQAEGFGADCSRLDRTVIYTSFGPGGFNIWKIPIDGGDPSQVVARYALIPSVSPDGKQFACYHVDDVTRSSKIGLYPIEGGDAIKQFDIVQPVGAGTPPIRWLPDGRSLTYIGTSNGVSNLWLQPVDGGPQKQLTAFKADRIFWFDISPDGKQIALSRGPVSNDVVLIITGRSKPSEPDR